MSSQSSQKGQLMEYSNNITSCCSLESSTLASLNPGQPGTCQAMALTKVTRQLGQWLPACPGSNFRALLLWVCGLYAWKLGDEGQGAPLVPIWGTSTTAEQT